MSAPLLHHFSLEGFDPGSMIETVQHGSFSHTQLAPGHFNGKLLHLQQRDVCVDWGRYNLAVLAEGAFSSDTITAGFVFQEHKQTICNGATLHTNSILMFSEGHELVIRLPDNCNWLSVQMRRDLLARLGLQLPNTYFFCRALSKRMMHRLHASFFPSLRLLDSVSDRPGDADSVRISQTLAEIQDVMIATILSTMGMSALSASTSRDTTARTSYRLARIAARYIDANLTQPITVAEVCCTSGCTYKSLHRAFLKAYGMAPKAYLQKRRLACLRRMLLKPENGKRTLTDLYVNCGLTHLGRASEAYKALYREAPTLSTKVRNNLA